MSFEQDDFLQKCIDCGERFFTQGEKDFYESKNLRLSKKSAQAGFFWYTKPRGERYADKRKDRKRFSGNSKH